MNDQKFTPPSRKSDLFGMMATIVVFFALVSLVGPAKALAGCIVFGAFLAIIQTKPKEMRTRKFWTILTIFGVIHVLALTLIRIPDPRFGLMSLPFALADGLAMWGLINWIERRFPTVGSGGQENR